jgi:hypothetical protein
MTRVLRTLRERPYAEFADLFNPSGGVPELVVTLLAVLELEFRQMSCRRTRENSLTARIVGQPARYRHFVCCAVCGPARPNAHVVGSADARPSLDARRNLTMQRLKRAAEGVVPQALEDPDEPRRAGATRPVARLTQNLRILARCRKLTFRGA